MVGYAQVREVAFRAWTRPESDRALRRRQFQIVDDQARLPGAVNVKPGLRPGQDDFHLSPHARLQVRVGFIESGRFFPRALPWPVWKRDVLGRVVPAKLVVRPAIGRTQVK